MWAFSYAVCNPHILGFPGKRNEVDVQAIDGGYGAEGEVTDKLDQPEIYVDLVILPAMTKDVF